MLKVFSSSRRRALFLWVFCILMALLKLWLVQDQGITARPSLSLPWYFVKSADYIAKGQWLGAYDYTTLTRSPGYPLWLALNHLAGVPARLGIELLWLFSSLVFVAGLRRSGLSRPMTGLSFVILAFLPWSFTAFDEALSLTLLPPLFLLSLGALLFALFEPGRKALWLAAGFPLAWMWISLDDWYWVPLLAVSAAFFSWATADGIRSWKVRGRGTLLGLSFALLPILTADLTVRGINEAKYGKFVLQRPGLIDRILKDRTRKRAAPQKFFDRILGVAAAPDYAQVWTLKGWVAIEGGKPSRVELVDRQDSVFGATANFIERKDLLDCSALPCGFEIHSDFTRTQMVEGRLVVFDEKGGRFEFPAAAGNIAAVGLKGGVENISGEIPTLNLRDTLLSLSQRWIERWSSLSLYAAAVALILLLGLASPWPTSAGVKLTLFVFATGIALPYAFSIWNEGPAAPLKVESLPWTMASLFPLLALLLIGLVARGLRESDVRPLSKPLAWMSSLPPEKVFLFLALLFGPAWIGINPPFQAADEGAHAMRAFQLSEGAGLQSPVPGSLAKVQSRFWYLSFHTENKMDLAALREYLVKPLNWEEKGRIGSTGTFALLYIPQSLAIALGRGLDLSALVLMYMARLANFLCFALLVFLAIRWTPILKWGLFLLALLPMTFYQAASMSADVLVNGSAFLLVAFFLRLACDESCRLNWRTWFLLLPLALYVSLGKPVYMPLCLLFGLIPARKAGSWKKYCFQFALLLLICGGVSLAYHFMEGNLPVSDGTKLTPMAYWRQHPLHLPKALWTTLWVQSSFYIETFLGKLAWLDTVLPTSLRWFAGAALLAAALLESDSKIRFPWLSRLWALLAILIPCLLMGFLFYMTWTPVGKDVIEGIQGRYFIPLAPAFLLLFYRNRTLALPVATMAWAPVAAFIILTATTLVLVNRFYYL